MGIVARWMAANRKKGFRGRDMAKALARPAGTKAKAAVEREVAQELAPATMATPVLVRLSVAPPVMVEQEPKPESGRAKVVEAKKKAKAAKKK